MASGPKSLPFATTGALVRRLVRGYVRRHLGRLGLAVLCMGLGAGATAANAWLMQPVLDDVFLQRDARMLVAVPLAVLALAVIKGIASYADEVTMTHVGQRIIAEIQDTMFAHLMRADLAFFHGRSTGGLVSRFTNDVQLLRGAVTKSLTGIVKDALTVVFLVALMFHQDWQLAAISFFAFPAAVLPIVRLGRRMRRVSADTQAELGALATLLGQAFQGARHVKAYGMEAYEAGRARAVVERIFGLTMRAARVRTAVRPIMETLGGLAIAVVIYYGGSRVVEGTTTPGTFFSFITALLLAYQPVKNLANLNTSLQEGLAAAQRVFEMLDVEPAIRDRPGAAALPPGEGAIRFEDVVFGYGPEAPALDGVSLTVPAGKTAALVGPSGAGKSTLLNLIPRFYDVDAGRVSIDGTDVRDATLASLRARIALVSQEITLFDDSVRANIAYGRPGAAQSEIEAAARAAAAHDFIQALPQGYDTPVGEHGVKLSGGQRQRLAIARAMLKDAPILLLDEATSALDTESERQVQAALRQLMAGRTTLVIAHRLSTVAGADVIYVVDRGRIVETGTHGALLAGHGTYARLYALQFAGTRDEQARGAPQEDPARASA